MEICAPEETGHNWGSFHDPPEDGCENQFLMYEFAHSGNNLNNFVSLTITGQPDKFTILSAFYLMFR